MRREGRGREEQSEGGGMERQKNVRADDVYRRSIEGSREGKEGGREARREGRRERKKGRRAEVMRE